MWNPDANFEASWNGKPAVQFSGWPAFLMILALAVTVGSGLLALIVGVANLIIGGV